MPRYAKVLLWSFLGLILPLVIGVVVLATMNWNLARPWVSQQIAEVINRPVLGHGSGPRTL
jgi:uncharacterized protein involved in outer membrane biogenesis